MTDYNDYMYDYNESDAKALTEDEMQDLMDRMYKYYVQDSVKGSLGQDYNEVKEDE
jgi:hypothetical protein